MNVILSKNLTNVFVVVVRYFGGTLLGVSGLINAYKSASLLTIENGLIDTQFVKNVFQIGFEFDKTNEIIRIIKEFGLKILR